MTTVQKNIRIQWALNNRVKKYAEMHSVSETEFFTQAIEEKLSRKKIEDDEVFRVFKQISKLDVGEIKTNIRELKIDKLVTINLIKELIEEQREIKDFIKTLRIRKPEPQLQTKTDDQKCPRCNSVLKRWSPMGFREIKPPSHLACTNKECNFAKPFTEEVM